jgi:hypothetical protein
MKSLLITFALALVIPTSPAKLFAQLPSQLVSPRSNARRKTKVDVKYDKKTDLSTARLERIVLWEHPIGFEQISMTVSFDYPKRTIVTPKSVSLAFSSVTKGRRGFVNEDCLATVDGSKVDLGPLERRGNRDLMVVPGGSYFDRVQVTIPFADFARLAHAKKTTLAVGGNSCDLKDDQIQMLADFLQLMQQEGLEFK